MFLFARPWAASGARSGNPPIKQKGVAFGQPKAKDPKLGESAKEIATPDLVVFLTVILAAAIAPFVLQELFKVTLARASEWVMLFLMMFFIGMWWKVK